MQTQVTINGNTYHEADLAPMDRASLRVIARIYQAEHAPDVSRAWIGSMASAQDLRDFVLGKPVNASNGSTEPKPVDKAESASAALATLAEALNGFIKPSNTPTGATQAQLDEVNERVDRKVSDAVECAKARDAQLKAELEANIASSQQMVVDYVDHLLASNVKTVSFVLCDAEVARVEGLRHCNFDDLLADIMAFRVTGQVSKANFWLVGEAGTGKTTAAEKIAESLGLKFYFNGAIDSEYKLRGFIDAQGRVIHTPFRQAYEHGGVYLFDEVDSSLPSACLAFNAALANGCYDFPGVAEPIKRHPDCVVIAASNTWGGPTGEYVGRFKQDAAFMDRFMRISWETDERLEKALCANQDWCAFVQSARANVHKHGIEHIISPRATFNGDILLSQNRPWNRVVEICVRKGLDDADWAKIMGGN